MSAIKASDSELKDPAVQETLSFSLPLLPYYCLMVQSTCSSRIGEQLSTDPFGVGVVQWLVPHFLLVDGYLRVSYYFNLSGSNNIPTITLSSNITNIS